MEISATDWAAAIRLTLRLATVTTLFLLLIGTPLAWWLADGLLLFSFLVLFILLLVNRRLQRIRA